MKKRPLILCLAILMAFLIPFSAPAADRHAPAVEISKQNLTVDGKAIDCEKYNIDGANYFKLRDIAYLLRSTGNAFQVGYDTKSNTVTITKGMTYTPTGTELVVGKDQSSTAVVSKQSIQIDGTNVSNLSAYNIGGNNYFKLRDLGTTLGFSVGYDQTTNTATITTSSAGSATSQTIREDGTYDSKEDVALYIHQYGHLPGNYIKKEDAQALGWDGGSLDPYAPGKCIGGSHFGNYEGLLPDAKGRRWTECDIDTLGADGRGEKRIVFSNDGLIYYTDNHYKSFTQLY